VLTRQMRCC